MNFPEKANQEITAIFFDFGGVIADEGFKQGLMAIGSRLNLEPRKFFEIAEDAIYETGYVVGRVLEADYWSDVRQKTGVTISDLDMRMEILSRFKLRPWMLRTVDTLRLKGYFVALLSDQTNWLDELDARSHFCGRFDAVFNSYYLGKGKKDVSIFSDVASVLGIVPESCLFIDDNPGNIVRASSLTYKTILFSSREFFFQELLRLGLLSERDIMIMVSDD